MVEFAAGSEEVLEPAKESPVERARADDAFADVACVVVVEPKPAAKPEAAPVFAVCLFRGLGGLVGGLGGDVVDGLGVLAGGGGSHCAIFLSGGKPRHINGA